MSLHASIVMVKADIRGDMRTIFEAFELKPIGVEAVQGWEAAIEAIRYPRPDSPRTTVHKAVTFCNGWTVVLDPEMVLTADDHGCRRVIGQYSAPLFGMICEGTSGTYAFYWHDKDVRRAFCIVDGAVTEDDGNRIPEESGIDLKSLFEDDVLLIMGRLGVPYSDVETASSFDVWAIDESSLVSSQSPAAPVAPAPRRRRWWQLW